MRKVYKLWGESYEICESPKVYATRDLALIGAEAWKDFLHMSVEEALEDGEIDILSYDLIEK